MKYLPKSAVPLSFKEFFSSGSLFGFPAGKYTNQYSTEDQADKVSGETVNAVKHLAAKHSDVSSQVEVKNGAKREWISGSS